MKTIIKYAFVATGLVCAGAFAGCSGNEPSEDPSVEADEDLGRVNLKLEVDGNQVDSISYVITDDDDNIVETATIDVSPDVANAQAWVLLPPGDFHVELTSEAMPPGGTEAYPCEGGADFSVTANDNTQVPVTLVCSVPGAAPVTGDAHINADFTFVQLDACGVTEVFAGPTATSADGGVVTLQAEGTAGLTYEWSDDGAGVFADPAAADTTYTCDGVGQVQITLTVSNEEELCEDSATFSIQCLGAPNCGNGTFEPELGEECDPNDPGLVGECTSSCTIVECGDTFLEGSEQCDDGNVVSGDGCTDECVLEFCGDGTVQLALGEECEPPTASTTPGDCDLNCQIIEAAPLTCDQCTETSCSAQLAACEDPVNEVLGGPNRCLASIACFEEEECVLGQPDELTVCLCGTNSPLDCAGGYANGPCQDEMRLAASTLANPASILNTILRAVDSGFPEGDAGQLVACQLANCQDACAHL